MDKQVVAIGLYCKQCQVEADIHHAYLEEGRLYIQGDCSECGDTIRFSCDDLYISLMAANPKDIQIN